MDVVRSLAEARQLVAGGAVALGNFDGVHLGHRALLTRAAGLAHASGGRAAALTFEPHPAKVLAPALAPPLIDTPEKKLELLAAAGMDVAIVLPFDAALAVTPPGDFAAALLDTGVVELVVGFDFSYGRARAGGVETLRQAALGRARVHVVPPVRLDGGDGDGLVVSSTRVREFVLAGRVDAAALLLDRPFSLDGVVVKGVGRGRQLGYPTANLATANELMPGLGVYAVRCRLDRRGPAIRGAANIGVNPTFRPDVAPGESPGRTPVSLEVFLIDFPPDGASGEIYERTLRVEFIQRLRPERRFPGVDALKAQIALDVEAARAILG